eukprot:6205936-Pleurochrysis_carterae.AAC.1
MRSKRLSATAVGAASVHESLPFDLLDVFRQVRLLLLTYGLLHLKNWVSCVHSCAMPHFLGVCPSRIPYTDLSLFLALCRSLIFLHVKNDCFGAASCSKQA